MVNCPPGCSQYHTKVKEINGFDIFDCSLCNHRFVKIDKTSQHVSKYYGDSYFFNSEFSGYPDYLKEGNLLRERGKKYAKILKKLRIKNGKLLDVGSAAGFILKGFVNEGWEGEGIEPNETMVKYAKNELGLNVHKSSLEDFNSENKFDCVTMIQVMAHFYDLDMVMKKLNSLLNDGKYVLIETWNRSSLTAKLLGWNWHEYSPPTVIHWFSDKSLINMFEKNNFSLVKQGRVFKRINAEHAKSLFIEKFNSNIIKFLLKLIPSKLNIIYPSEDLFYIILKKNS